MPDADGKLTKEERAQVVKWLADHWPKQACPMCGTVNWGLDDNIARVDVWHPTKRLAPLCFPAAVMVCTNCAYLAFFSAVQMKIMAGAEKENQQAEEQPRTESPSG